MMAEKGTKSSKSVKNAVCLVGSDKIVVQVRSEGR